MATLSIPQANVVSIPTAAERITQDELANLIEARNAEAQLAEMARTLEKSIRERLESGADVQPGIHTAALKETLRRSPEWKAVVVRLAERLDLDGDAYCSNVLAHTKPTRTVSLVVN